MKSLIKGAILGAVAGVAAPVALSVANETLWAAKSSGSIANTRICFAQRHWYIFKPNIKHAKGCRNQLLDSIPLFLLVGVLGGSLISALALISKGNKDVDTATASPEPPVVLPPTPKAPDVVLSAPQPPVPTPPVAEFLNQPPIQSITSGVKQSGGRLKDFDWRTIRSLGKVSFAKTIAIVSGIAVAVGIGVVGANNAIKSSLHGNNANLQWVSPAYAQSLPDGKYIDWEEDYLVKNGKLVACTGVGKSGNTCAGISASYAGPRAIYLTKSGRTWLVCNLKFNKGGGMGPPGSGGYCTVNGWN